MKRAKLREFVAVSEKHHIIPKSLGGSNDSTNIVKLSPREHYIAHLLLTKMVCSQKHRRSCAYAFVRMKQSNNKLGYNRVSNSRLYEMVKLKQIKLFSGKNNPFYGDSRFSGKNNPFYGKKHTEEVKKKISTNLKGKMVGNKNPFFGKTHTEQTKLMLSEHQKKSVAIVFLNGERVFFERRIDIGKYLNISVSLGVQLCTIKKHLWAKYNIEDIVYESKISS